MFNETETNFVAVAGALEARHPNVFFEIQQALAYDRIPLHVIPKCRNIWARDFLPIQVGKQFYKFDYGYGKDNPEFTTLKVREADWKWLPEVRRVNIRLDGGNIIRHGDDVIMTDIIFRHNPHYEKNALISKLEVLFCAELTVVPTEPNDDIGHTDGICHFTPAGTLLVGDYRMNQSRGYSSYYRRLKRELSKFDVIDFPLSASKCPRLSEKDFRKRYPNADTFNPGFGYYINFLTVGKLVLLPQFGLEEDKHARTLVKFPGFTVVPIPCAALSMEGGLINCVTMNYRM